MVSESIRTGVKCSCVAHQLIFKLSSEHQTLDHTNILMGNDHDTIFVLFHTKSGLWFWSGNTIYFSHLLPQLSESVRSSITSIKTQSKVICFSPIVVFTSPLFGPVSRSTGTCVGREKHGPSYAFFGVLIDFIIELLDLSIK